MLFFFFQAEDGIRDGTVTGVQTCALPISSAQSVLEAEQSEDIPQAAPVYGRQEIKAPFERSSLAITLLFVGGLVLEVFGGILWSVTQSASAGLPLFVAGFVAVIMAIIVRRQQANKS